MALSPAEWRAGGRAGGPRPASQLRSRGRCAGADKADRDSVTCVSAVRLEIDEGPGSTIKRLPLRARWIESRSHSREGEV